MLVYNYAEWDWVASTLDYQLVFLTAMYEPPYIDLAVDVEPRWLA